METKTIRKAVVMAAVIMMCFICMPLKANARARVGKDAKIATGYYMLVPTCATDKALMIKGNSKISGKTMYTYTYKQKGGQIFKIRSIGKGKYTIQNKRSKLYLEVQGSKKKTKTDIKQKPYKNSKRQKWYITNVSGTYVIQSCYSLTTMTVTRNMSANKTKVWAYRYRDWSGQKWKLIPWSKSSSTQTSSAFQAASAKKSSVRAWNDLIDYPIFTNIIGAVESGGQIYGNRDYGSYVAPYTGSAIEHTITLGWAQFYGDEAQELIRSIINAIPAQYKIIDPKGLMEKALKKNWEDTRYNPTVKEKEIIKKLIVTDAGKRIQDQQFQQTTSYIIEACKKEYTDEAPAVYMYTQIRHLGGPAAARKIFDKCKKKGDYSLTTIIAALAEDQLDTSSDNQVGDIKFWTRHMKVVEFIEKYVL